MFTEHRSDKKPTNAHSFNGSTEGKKPHLFHTSMCSRKLQPKAGLLLMHIYFFFVSGAAEENTSLAILHNNHSCTVKCNLNYLKTNLGVRHLIITGMNIKNLFCTSWVKVENSDIGQQKRFVRTIN